MLPAESLDDFHMPNNSIIPFVMSFGLFVASFGSLYFASGKEWAIDAVADLPVRPWAGWVLAIGLAITFISMITRSFKDDLGYYVPKEEVLRDLEEQKRGAK